MSSSSLASSHTGLLGSSNFKTFPVACILDVARSGFQNVAPFNAPKHICKFFLKHLPSTPPPLGFPRSSRETSTTSTSTSLSKLLELKDHPKPQGRAYKVLVECGPTNCLAQAILPRVRAWLFKYFDVSVSLDVLVSVKNDLNHASSHFAAGVLKTLTNAWVTSHRFGTQTGQATKCLFCKNHDDAMQHILVCPMFSGPVTQALNRALAKHSRSIRLQVPSTSIYNVLGFQGLVGHPFRFLFIAGACHIYHKIKALADRSDFCVSQDIFQ